MALRSDERKFRRALQHLQNLDKRLDRFAERNRNRLAFKVETQTGEDELVTYYTGTIPPLSWSVLIGDCIQNFRSSLDHMIFELAPQHERLARPKQFMFPIFLDSNEYSRHGSWRIKNLPQPGVISAIESLQPYKTRNPDHFLWQLEELSNVDKHRAVHVAASLLTDAQVHYRYREYVATLSTPPTRPKRLAHNSELLRFRRLDFRVDGTPIPISEVEVNFDFAVQVSFADAGDASEHGVRSTLHAIRDAVEYSRLLLAQYL